MWVGNDGIEFIKKSDTEYESNSGIVLCKKDGVWYGNDGRDYWFNEDTMQISSNCGIDGVVIDDSTIHLNNGRIFELYKEPEPEV